MRPRTDRPAAVGCERTCPRVSLPASTRPAV